MTTKCNMLHWLPNVICYTDYQMKHFSSDCKTSVIGVDRTFNLGACFVTTVFQESKLKRKGKNTNPIILGPVYLHWDGDFHTIYQRFFTHLASVLDTGIPDTLLSFNDFIGSDEEKALVKAIQSSFPQSKLTV